jgi:signal transduction histidine kinase
VSVRLRLTLTYAAVLVVCGALLLGASYALVARSLDGAAAQQTSQQVGVDGRLSVSQPPAAQLNDSALADLRANYALALVAMAMGAAALGWLLAGRTLRPLHAIAATARAVSSDTLDRRVALAGPSDELKQLGDTVDTMLARLDSSFASQQRFVANASHELRTPLAVIRTEVDVALADPDASAAELRATAERVRAATDRSERLIESLLTLARTESPGAGTAHADAVDLAAAVEHGIDGVGGELRDAGIELRRDLRCARARGDRRLLERLAANLVENAVRHNVPGGWIELSTANVAGRVRLSVANSGQPIPPGRVAELVEPFQRLARHAPGSGAGLGLSIVRSVAEAHGGSLAVAARPDGGLAVEVELPAAALTEPLTAPGYPARR